MKKFFLSSFVISTFLIYVVHNHLDSSELPQVILKNSSRNNPLDAPASTQPSLSVPITKNLYKDGAYLGAVADAFYGNIQVKAIISDGKITDVQFLQYPNDRRTSIMINTQAMPSLRSEAIQSQNAQVDIVSGATQTSKAFRDSLQSALTQAKL